MNGNFIKAIDEDATEISQILEDCTAYNREIPPVHNVEQRVDYRSWLIKHTSIFMIHNNSVVVGFRHLKKL